MKEEKELSQELKLFKEVKLIREDLPKYQDIFSTTSAGRDKKEIKDNERAKKDRSKALDKLIRDKGEYMDTRIRGIERRTWEAFKQYCREQSAQSGQNISANKMIIQMIETIVEKEGE